MLPVATIAVQVGLGDPKGNQAVDREPRGYNSFKGRQTKMDKTDFARWRGVWRGENLLHDPMTNSEQRSPTTFQVNSFLCDTFLDFAYDWQYEGKRQEGRLTVGVSEDQTALFATWIDTWHMNSDFLILKGKPTSQGFDLLGEYKVEGHPNWGWSIGGRIEGDQLQIVMKNISPEKEEYPAVEITASRP